MCGGLVLIIVEEDEDEWTDDFEKIGKDADAEVEHWVIAWFYERCHTVNDEAQKNKKAHAPPRKLTIISDLWDLKESKHNARDQYRKASQLWKENTWTHDFIDTYCFIDIWFYCCIVLLFYCCIIFSFSENRKQYDSKISSGTKIDLVHCFTNLFTFLSISFKMTLHQKILKYSEYSRQIWFV